MTVPSSSLKNASEFLLSPHLEVLLALNWTYEREIRSFLRSLPRSGTFIKHVWNLLFCSSFSDPLHHNWQCPVYKNYSINWGVCAWRKLSIAWNRVLLGIYRFYCYDYDCTGEKTMKVEVNLSSSGCKYRQYVETFFMVIIGQLAVVVNILL